jgi:hypothetical protein
VKSLVFMILAILFSIGAYGEDSYPNCEVNDGKPKITLSPKCSAMDGLKDYIKYVNENYSEASSDKNFNGMVAAVTKKIGSEKNLEARQDLKDKYRACMIGLASAAQHSDGSPCNSQIKTQNQEYLDFLENDDLRSAGEPRITAWH